MKPAVTWAQLPLGEIFPWVLPVLVLATAILLPGRRVAVVSALAVAFTLPLVPDRDLSRMLLVGWMALWVVVAAILASSGEPAHRPLGRPSGAESSAVGLMLGAALLVLLLWAVVRQRLPNDAAARSALGLGFLVVGLLHLMLRRDSMRALLAFAALGFGIQWLEWSARAALLSFDQRPSGVTLLVTTLAVGMVHRIARARSLGAGSSWVSDAHDLHD